MSKGLNFCTRWGIRIAAEIAWTLLSIGDTKGHAGLSNALTDLQKSLTRREDREEQTDGQQ